MKERGLCRGNVTGLPILFFLGGGDRWEGAESVSGCGNQLTQFDKFWLPLFLHQSLPDRSCLFRSDGLLTFQAIEQELEFGVPLRVFLKVGKMPTDSHEKQFVIVTASTHNEMLSLHMLGFPFHILAGLQFKSVAVQTPGSFVGNRVTRYVGNNCEDVTFIGNREPGQVPWSRLRRDPRDGNALTGLASCCH